ncbi:MAG: 3-hydroxyacyl-CoA dehydrogenase family protein [Euryarchaeota archaeon]|nr:3-hydroxyacyl-CoA dehydrogenase family protein [Euryarchaeota archaeon]
MGTGIAQACAMAGYGVVAVGRREEALGRAVSEIRTSLARQVEKGRLAPAGVEEALGRIKAATSLEDLWNSDLIIEAITEDLEAKRTLFQTLDALSKPSAILATNTSSIPIARLAEAVSRRDRFIGLHFFSPVAAMGLVEVVPLDATDGRVLEEAEAFVTRLGKTAIRAPDRPGFLVNRLLVPYLMDAVRMVEEGGSAEDIDKGMRLGCGHPMGPLTLLDHVGLDTALTVAKNLYRESGDRRFEPPRLLEEMVAGGRLGRKSGEGFYRY